MSMTLDGTSILRRTRKRASSSCGNAFRSKLTPLGFFLLGDSLNTTVTVIGTLQNTVTSFNTLTLTYLLIVGIAAQLAGIWGFWTIQKRFKLSTKVMFNAIMVGIILLDGWGMIGIWTHKFGFHNEWEFWVYQVSHMTTMCRPRLIFGKTGMVRTLRLPLVLLLANHD